MWAAHFSFPKDGPVVSAVFQHPQMSLSHTSHLAGYPHVCTVFPGLALRGKFLSQENLLPINIPASSPAAWQCMAETLPTHRWAFWGLCWLGGGLEHPPPAPHTSSGVL